MVGHSKGDLSIATALDNLTQEQCEELIPRLKVTTLSALVELPPSLAGVRQFMGMLDGFGLMNSTLPQAAVFVPWATHTLNTRLPFHLSAEDALERGAVAGVESGMSAGPSTAQLPQFWFDPSRVLSDWMNLCAGATIAVEAALEESARSIRQGIEATYGSRVR